jgi:hypothetical protein
MKESLQIQFGEEHKAWQRRLEFLRQENALLKYRLSEMLDNTEDNYFLQMAEHFQNELLLKDEKLKTLFSKIQKFHADTNRMSDEKKGIHDLIERQSKLRNDIFEFEKQFLNLANEFNKKMLQSI